MVVRIGFSCFSLQRKRIEQPTVSPSFFPTTRSTQTAMLIHHVTAFLLFHIINSRHLIVII